MSISTLIFIVIIVMIVIAISGAAAEPDTKQSPTSSVNQTPLPIHNAAKHALTRMYEEVECPKCSFKPTQFTMWLCSPGCNFLWSTFDTHGKCPNCSKLWQDTLCPSCNTWSKHADWYLAPMYVSVDPTPPPKVLKAAVDIPKNLEDDKLGN